MVISCNKRYRRKTLGNILGSLSYYPLYILDNLSSLSERTDMSTLGKL